MVVVIYPNKIKKNYNHLFISTLGGKSQLSQFVNLPNRLIISNTLFGGRVL